MIQASQFDLPGPLAEVAAAFAVYEDALRSGDAIVLNQQFWVGTNIVRFGVADRQHGFDEVARWRQRQGPLSGRKLRMTEISTFGDDTAVVTTLFSYPDRPVEGRQSQTWIRFSDGWKIVSAHVSEVAAADG